MSTTAPSGSRKRRPHYPIALKRRLAQQACAPGVSVSRLARERGIHVNLLFRWRTHYRAGLLSVAPTTPPALLPVTIVAPPAPPASLGTPTGRIVIVIADVIVRIDGAADAATVRAVLQGMCA
jgi:transposase